MLPHDVFGAKVEGAVLPELFVPVLALRSCGWDVQRWGHLIGNRMERKVQEIRAEERKACNDHVWKKHLLPAMLYWAFDKYSLTDNFKLCRPRKKIMNPLINDSTLLICMTHFVNVQSGVLSFLTSYQLNWCLRIMEKQGDPLQGFLHVERVEVWRGGLDVTDHIHLCGKQQG